MVLPVTHLWRYARQAGMAKRCCLPRMTDQMRVSAPGIIAYRLVICHWSQCTADPFHGSPERLVQAVGTSRPTDRDIIRSSPFLKNKYDHLLPSLHYRTVQTQGIRKLRQDVDPASREIR